MLFVFQALREEQNEAAMAMSSTTVGDDDASVDTINTADTPTTNGSRNSRPRSQRVPSIDSPAAAAAAAGAYGEGGVASWSRRGNNTPSRNGAAAAAAANANAKAEGAPPEDGKAATASPLMPTPPRLEINVETLVVSVLKLVGLGWSARAGRGRGGDMPASIEGGDTF